jgi:hypothetical protein
VGIFDAITEPVAHLVSAGTDLIGGVLGNNAQEELYKQSYKNQKEFAQKSIRWKVADAKAAGIHPLAALGVNPVPYQPASVGKDYSYLSDMGQDISRAVAANQTKEQRRLTQLALDKAEAELVNQRIQNMIDMKRLRNNANGQGTVPPVGNPYDGIIEEHLGGKGYYYRQNEIPAHSNGIASGVLPFEQYSVKRTGEVEPVISQSVSEGMESSAFTNTKNFIQQTLNWAGNLIRNNWADSKMAKRSRNEIRKLRKGLGRPPKGKEFRFNPWTNTFWIAPKKNRFYVDSWGNHHIKQ